jgi:hypothetical protein
MLCISAHRLSCAFVCAANGNLLAAVETADAALVDARQGRGGILRYIGTKTQLFRHLPGDGLVEAEIAIFDRFWQCQFLGTGLSCIQASDVALLKKPYGGMMAAGASIWQ